MPTRTHEATASGSVAPRTVQEAVEDWIRQAILTGKLPGGSKLVQEPLAKELGASRVPIREALRKLEAEGLVRFTPHRGAVVTPISAEDVKNIFELRVALETLAARRGAAQLTPADLAEMSRLVIQMRRATRAPDVWLELNRRFHSTIYAASGNPRLVRLIDGLRAQTTPYQRLSIKVPGRMGTSEAEHSAILEGCVRRDGPLTARATTDHLHRTERLLIDLLESAR